MKRSTHRTGMRRLGLTTGLIAGVWCVPNLAFVPTYVDLLTPHHTEDLRTLERLLPTEAHALGLDCVRIGLQEGPVPHAVANVRQVGAEEFVISLDELRNRHALRHELYHIHLRRCEPNRRSSSYAEYWWTEMKCSLYAYANVKL
jgi:hypothetical protein